MGAEEGVDITDRSRNLDQGLGDRHPVFVERVGRQVNAVVPIDHGSAFVQLNAVPQADDGFEVFELFQCGDVVIYVVQHPAPIIA